MKKNRLNIKDGVFSVVFGELLLVLVNIICYQSIYWMLPLQFFMIPYFRVTKDFLKNKRRRVYQQGFKELLASLMTSMQAGYSFENACILANEELAEIYKEKHPMRMQLQLIVQGIELHIPTDQLFMRYARETQVADAFQLAVLLAISNKVGTNMVVVLKGAMESMQDKLATSEEIDVLLSGKTFEKNIMLLMPFGILLYMQIANPGYLSFFYTSLFGHLLMTIVLLVVVACFFWTEKIMRIET